MNAQGKEPGPPAVKRSVALVIRRARGRRVLAVLRPPDDEHLPDVWGLPAASLGPGESWEDAVRRAAREKLGVEVEVGPVLGEGRKARPAYRLEMRLYGARIVRGRPAMGQPPPGVTRYVGWMWGEPGLLEAAAARGSLCARLFLDAEGRTPGR